jgi:tetratricopeptide (TPR) repeat protein
MEPNIFSPKIQQINKDGLEGFLRSLSQSALILVFGLLPFFFVPGIYTSLGFTKFYFVALGIFAAFALLSLSILRSGSIRIVTPLALIFLWSFTLLAVASSLLSGDRQDSLFGNALEIHTSGFMVMMALVATAALAFSGSKSAITRLFSGLAVGALILQLFHVSRLIFGPEFLAFGLFTSSTSSPIGSFNDLAIFSGLIILVSLIVLQQVSTHVVGKVVSTFLILSSLLIMIVVNFGIVWLTVGFFSLLVLLYLVSKDTWLKKSDEETVPVSRFVLGMVGVICLVSAAFVISGDSLGGLVSRVTNISYLEIRPSTSATLDITKAVLSENALFGIGPNRFEDAWRQYKNPVINETVFWNTNFAAGNGYVPTLFATTGLAGGVMLILFLGSFIYLAYRTFFVVQIKDYGWYLVGTVSFASAIYLWFMAIVYVPGVVILLLAALMTGLSMAVYITATPNTGVQIDVSTHKQYGALLIAFVLVVIISSVLSIITVSKQYLAGVGYANTVRDFRAGADLQATDNGLSAAQALFAQDLFLNERAQLRLAELARLSSVEPASFDEQQYSNVLAEGIGLAEQAIRIDFTNPNNHLVLSRFYGLLDPTQFEGARERTDLAFSQAITLDPTNPSYNLEKAQYNIRLGDLTAARSNLQEAIRQKGNYTDALFLLSQLDIQEGNTESAIAVTRSIISIEPNNPTRYFQLGVLLATTNNLPVAIQAFEAAVSLDTNYANARYFLALAYLDSERTEDALSQLRIVEESNPDNETVKVLIEQVTSGTYQKEDKIFGVPVQNTQTVSQEDDITTATEVPDTDLVTPLNRSLPSNRQDSPVPTPVEEPVVTEVETTE